MSPCSCEVNYVSQAKTSFVMSNGTTAEGGGDLLLSRVSEHLGANC
ncbi:hypothetical protein [Anabaena sp. UHCC 0399]|nr:hypothetical protein [Anabaena sp. UHCC 0399]MEA5569152.1 hypothetical protein [Anabaena sp. UHCC 0399]